MDIYPELRKCLAFVIILLFIGVAFVPSINFNVVKASYDNNLLEVTSQACGINGLGNITVKLTTQQYQNLKYYLVDFIERLNQMTTREEAVPLFKDAVVELNKYGLLPKGINVAQMQRLVLSGNKNAVIDRLTYKHTDTESLISYYFITGIVHINLSIGIISGIGMVMEYFGWRFGHRLLLSIGLFINYLGVIINSISPVVAFSLIKPSEGNIITIDRFGIKKVTFPSSDYNQIAIYTGIKITAIFSGETFLLGFAGDVQYV